MKNGVLVDMKATCQGTKYPFYFGVFLAVQARKPAFMV
jgi:hypothetical protein